MTNIDYSKPYIQYAQNVIDNKILACKWIKLACERFMSLFYRDDIYFDYDDVDMKIRFVGKMKHFVDEFADKPFILYDWQQWIFAGIFGFKYINTGYRVTKNVLLFISRKNGKSSLASALGIASLIADKEAGAEVALLANSTKQASLLFEKMDAYISSIDPDQLIFQRYRHTIKVPATKSKVVVHSADPKALDGYNCSTFILDEYHAAKDSKVYDLMKNSQGMRKQPLAIVITTAGFNVGEEYPLYSMWQMCCEILSNAKRDDSQFAALYMLDEEDDWKNKLVWKKCSPGYPEIVDSQFMDAQLVNATNNPANEVEFKTKLMNMWCTSAETWIPREDLLEHTQVVDLKSFNKLNPDEYYCYVGVDLAQVNDLTAISYMVEKDNVCYFKTDCYIPDGTLQTSKNKDLYGRWIRDGYLKVTHGKRMNYDEVIADILKVNEYLPVLQVLYDSYNAQDFKNKMEQEGFVMTAFKQTKGAFNQATKGFELALYNNQIVIDENPVIRWCFANVQLKYDSMENVKPEKGQGANNKIDAVIAMLEAYGGWLNNAKFTANIELV